MLEKVAQKNLGGLGVMKIINATTRMRGAFIQYE